MIPATWKSAWAAVPAGRQRAFKIAFGVIVGGSLGLAYYSIVGCSTGTCPITSSPWISTAWGAAIGGFTAAG